MPLKFLPKEFKSNLLTMAKESIINNASWIYELEEIFTYYELFPKKYSNKDKEQIRKS